ncbi:CobW family GTP-binding protein [Algoriphagus sediminis]|uniref:GTP-binding protein n=1 Tax=Algoriphagus sediminis TaxID=3057113 RepID=A0ABT7YD35_9BACT|nr:GTP-binding protein [Algoriphagus sediminis]MDN3204441.1 GTP-binding protein [Algoriphagus sediminis]
MDQIPVHIITGFLGSGKTTFLNNLIGDVRPDRVLVIENECGETNIDGAIIVDGVEDIVELNAGCICCSLADGLLEALEAISKKKKEIDRLVIETTGIADPSSIIQAFLQDPRVEAHFDLRQVICLVDAGLVEDWLSETDEALRQIVASDVILLNKSDTVTPNYLSKIENLLKGINPQSEVMKGEFGAFSMDKIEEFGTTQSRTIEKKANDHAHHHEHHHHLDHEVDSNSHKITTFTINLPKPLDLESLSLDLNRLVNLYRSQVYRVKGYIAIPNYPNRVILQSARTSFIATDGSPWKSNESREGRLVFIGRNLRKEVFLKMFQRHEQGQIAAD